MYQHYEVNKFEFSVFCDFDHKILFIVKILLKKRVLN